MRLILRRPVRHADRHDRLAAQAPLLPLVPGGAKLSTMRTPALSRTITDSLILASPQPRPKMPAAKGRTMHERTCRAAKKASFEEIARRDCHRPVYPRKRQRSKLRSRRRRARVPARGGGWGHREPGSSPPPAISVLAAGGETDPKLKRISGRPRHPVPRRSLPGTPRQRALEAIEKLPEDASVEEVMERLFFLSKVERGLEQDESGQVVAHEEAKRRFGR
jgi:hypothetical protein